MLFLESSTPGMGYSDLATLLDCAFLVCITIAWFRPIRSDGGIYSINSAEIKMVTTRPRNYAYAEEAVAPSLRG